MDHEPAKALRDAGYPEQGNHARSRARVSERDDWLHRRGGVGEESQSGESAKLEPSSQG